MHLDTIVELKKLVSTTEALCPAMWAGSWRKTSSPNCEAFREVPSAELTRLKKLVVPPPGKFTFCSPGSGKYFSTRWFPSSYA
jgi:hypothetical protein